MEILFLKFEAAGFPVHPKVRAYYRWDTHPYIGFMSKRYSSYIGCFGDHTSDENVWALPEYTYDQLIKKLDEEIIQSIKT